MAMAASDAPGAGMQQIYPGRAAVISWIFFDWAAQPYFTLITTFVFAPYFATHVASDPASGQSLWGFATAAAGLLIALMSPVLGDRGRQRPTQAVDRGVRRAAGDRLLPDVVRKAGRPNGDSAAAVGRCDRHRRR